MLEAFEDVGDEGASEVAGEAFDGGGVFFEECGQVVGGLVLLAEDVVVVFVEDAAIAGDEGDGDVHGDEEAGGLLGLGVVGEGGDGLGEDGAAKDGVRSFSGDAGVIGADAQAGAGCKFPNDGGRHDGFSAIGIGLGGEDGDGEGAGAGGQMGGCAEGVVATG